MTNYSVPSGTSSYGNTLTAASADAVTFADRYSYVSVTNLGATGVIYVTGNGVAPASDTGATSGEIAIPPGATFMVANALPYWDQSSNVIQQGVITIGNGNAYNASTQPSLPTQPGFVTYMESLAGKKANPGTVIGLLSASANAYQIVGAG